jgi:hypothetical protein
MAGIILEKSIGYLQPRIELGGALTEEQRSRLLAIAGSVHRAITSEIRED